MKTSSQIIAFVGGLCLATASVEQTTAPKPQYPDYPSETPGKFTAQTSSFDYFAAKP